MAFSTHTKQPLYLQISDTLRQQIIDGHLSPGTRLPASRNYAIELGVSRTSVVAALEQLKAEGYIKTRPGAGCYVSAMGRLDSVGNIRERKAISDQFDRWQPPSLLGHPSSADMRLFPYRQWAKCVAKVAREQPQAMMQVVDPFGDRNLRASIARYLLEWRGMEVAPQQILITAGSIDALEICVRTLINKNERIGLEDPGYLQLRHFVEQAGFSPVWMKVDQEGAQVPPVATSASANTPRMVVLTPSHQFPLGGAMSPARRAEFIRWAKQANAWIIEDDYDSEFRYAGKPIPALSSFDHANRAIYIGSFSKVFSTGLRLGFLVAPPNLLDDFLANPIPV